MLPGMMMTPGFFGTSGPPPPQVDQVNGTRTGAAVTQSVSRPVGATRLVLEVVGAGGRAGYSAGAEEDLTGGGGGYARATFNTSTSPALSSLSTVFVSIGYHTTVEGTSGITVGNTSGGTELAQMNNATNGSGGSSGTIQGTNKTQNSGGAGRGRLNWSGSSYGGGGAGGPDGPGAQGTVGGNGGTSGGGFSGAGGSGFSPNGLDFGGGGGATSSNVFGTGGPGAVRLTWHFD